MKSTDTSGLAIEQTLADGLVVREHESMTRLVWRRFRRHPGAVAGAVILSVIILASIFAFLSPYNPNESDIKSRLEPPSLQHPFGTDALGRDLLTRCLYGGRISLFVGLMVMVITLVIGIPIGMIAGYFGGWIDDILMRIIDAFLSLPSLLVLILLSAILREIEFPLLKANSVMT
ncbi:MAG: ABC transporter permease, partial [Chloroflexota bacterium]